MSKTLWQHHLEVIKLLQGRKEPTLKPKHRVCMGGTPEIYIKDRSFPSEEFKVGSGLKAKDGTFELIGEHLTWIISGLSIEELGLCDPAVEYENYDLLHPRKRYKTCSHCHGRGWIEE